MQNFVVFVEPSENAYDVSFKDGNKYLNRFSIDEDAAFELSGVHYLKEKSYTIGDKISKGKGYLIII